jgi:hypothetical protein
MPIQAGDFCSALADLVDPVRNIFKINNICKIKYFFPTNQSAGGYRCRGSFHPMSPLMCVTWDVLEKRQTGPLIPHLWYKGIAVIFLFSAFYFFSKWEGAFSREEITGWRENPSVKAFVVVLLLFYLGAWSATWAFVQMIDMVSLFLEEERKRHIFLGNVFYLEKDQD